MIKRKVLSVASEIYPLIKTGGLADVAGALPGALSSQGIEMVTLVPGYPSVLAALEQASEAGYFPNLFGGSARLLRARAQGLELFVLDAPHLYTRAGNPYTGPDGSDWPDNAFRFGALSKVAADIGSGLVPAFVPDIVHAHDWQAGLTPAYLRYKGRAAGPATVITIHNLAFQGQFPAEFLGRLGLPAAAFTVEGIEHYGAIGYLKAGLQLSDWITTVSPTYATEILRPEMGMGFDGLLRARMNRLSGILNGIDTKTWDPATDPKIAATFDRAHLDARSTDKTMLQYELDLRQEQSSVLIGVVSRLSWQKGLDMLLDALPVLLEERMQLAVVGVGENDLESKLRAAGKSHPGRVGIRLGYDETLAHRIQAGADVLLVPSRFEPCGLTQLCALRYGAVPVVSRVGGLSDTVIDANEMGLAAGAATGLQFSPVNSDSLAASLRKTRRLFHERSTWRKMQMNGMAVDVSWRQPARRYASLYRELTGLESLPEIEGETFEEEAVATQTRVPVSVEAGSIETHTSEAPAWETETGEAEPIQAEPFIMGAVDIQIAAMEAVAGTARTETAEIEPVEAEDSSWAETVAMEPAETKTAGLELAGTGIAEPGIIGAADIATVEKEAARVETAGIEPLEAEDSSWVQTVDMESIEAEIDEPQPAGTRIAEGGKVQTGGAKASETKTAEPETAGTKAGAAQTAGMGTAEAQSDEAQAREAKIGKTEDSGLQTAGAVLEEAHA